jgi:hypothetical protein
MRTLGDANKGGNSTPAPAGNHVGICVSVVFLGTHTEMTQWGEKTNEKLRITFELPEETKVFKEENGPEPFQIGQEYSFFMGEKARLRKDLEAWRNKPFTDEEMKAFEVKKLLGQPAMVQVAHKVSKKGSTYAAIEAITSVPKSIRDAIPKPHAKLTYYDYDQGQGSTFQDLPKFIQEKILSSEQFKDKSKPEEESQAPTEETNPDREPPEDLEVALGPKGNAGLATPDSDEIPFSPNVL